MKKISLKCLPSNIQDFLHFVSLEIKPKDVRAYLVGGMVRDFLG